MSHQNDNKYCKIANKRVKEFLVNRQISILAYRVNEYDWVEENGKYKRIQSVIF